MSATVAPTTPAPPPPPSSAPPPATSFWQSTALPSVLSVVMALVVGAVLIAVSDDDVRAASSYFFARPGDMLSAVVTSVVEAYGALFRGSVIDVGGTSVAEVLGPLASTLLFATPLVAAGLAVAIPFRAGLFNIGAEGQITVAAIFAAYVGFALDLPPVVHLVAAVLAGLVGGALWGAVPGVLKATTGAHEVITTIMLNYVARFGILFALGTTAFRREGRADPISPPIADTATLPRLLDFGRINLAFVLVLVAAAVAWWLINRSTTGFRLRAVGANPEAARTAGMSVPRTYVTAMVLAGTFAGLAGVSQVLGSERVLTTGISAGLGFDAITVALLARTNPVGVVAAGVLFGALKAGGLTMQATTGTSLDIVVVLQALIVLFIAAPALISAVFRLKSTGAGVGQLCEGVERMSAVIAEAPAPQAPSGSHVVAPRRSWRQPVVLWVLALLALLAFGLGSPDGTRSTFGLSTAGQVIQVPPLPLPTRPTAVVLALLALAIAAVVTWLVKERRPVSVWWTVGFGVCFAVAFLVWAVADQQVSLANLLQGSLFLATPLVFGALGGVLCERAGVINIAIEGQLLAGAFLSAVVASLVGGPAGIYVGLLAAPLAGLFFGWLLAVFAIRYLVDQVVLGVVINVLVVGLTSFLYGQVLVQDADRWNQPGRLPRVEIPVLSEIPVLGPVLFDQSLIVYLMYVAVLVLHLTLFRTRWGLRVRAVGEHPKAADTAGIDVNKVRFRNVLMGGAMAGLGGAFFTLGSVGAFGEEMTAGQGFIALAALIFGRWSPVGALVAALLFGVAGNLASVLSIIGSPIPGELLLMAPYLATIFAVAGLVGKVRAPAADGVPYKP